MINRRSGTRKNSLIPALPREEKPLLMSGGVERGALLIEAASESPVKARRMQNVSFREIGRVLRWHATLTSSDFANAVRTVTRKTLV